LLQAALIGVSRDIIQLLICFTRGERSAFVRSQVARASERFQYKQAKKQNN